MNNQIDNDQKKKMKIYRYMNFDEFIKMMSGLYIEEDEFRAKSEIMFIGEKTILEETYFDDNEKIKNEYTPQECYGLIRKVVSDEILVEFDVTEGAQIKKGYEYIVYELINYDAKVNAYYMEGYNKECLVPVRFLIPNRDNKSEWIQIEGNKYSLRDLLNLKISGMVEENGIIKINQKKSVVLNSKSIRYLPKMASTDSDNCMWRFFTEGSRNRYIKIGVEYGDILNDDSEKIRMEFNLSKDEENREYYILMEQPNCPDEWKEIYKKSPKFKWDSSVDEFLKYAVLRITYPKILEKIPLTKEKDKDGSDIFIIGDEGKIGDTSSETMFELILSENGEIIPGYDDKFVFVPFEEYVLERGEQNNTETQDDNLEDEKSIKKSIIDQIIKEKQEGQKLDEQINEQQCMKNKEQK